MDWVPCPSGRPHEEIWCYGDRVLIAVSADAPRAVPAKVPRSVNLVPPGKVQVLRNFLTRQQCDKIIDVVDAAPSSQLRRSTVARGADQLVDDTRTSMSLSASDIPSSLRLTLLSRIRDALGVKMEQIEMSVVRYDPGGKFELHHDTVSLRTLLGGDTLRQIPEPLSIIGRCVDPSTRIMSMFIYLNDGDGCTHFPCLRHSIRPECGSAAIWTNVRLCGREVCAPDERMIHEGCPTTVVKYGINVFISLS